MQEQGTTLPEHPAVTAAKRVTSLTPPHPEYIAAERFARWMSTMDVLQLVQDEREAQHAQWGDQDIPMGASKAEFGGLEEYMRTKVQALADAGKLTYAYVLLEEVYEALAEEDPAKMVDELVQAAAVAVKMAELLKRKLPVPTHPQPVQD